MVACTPGTSFSGLSFTAVIFIVAVSLPDRLPSLALIVSKRVATGVSPERRYVSVLPLLPANKSLSCAAVPLRIKVLVLTPDTITTPVVPTVAARLLLLPSPVRVMVNVSPSTSATLIPVPCKLMATCSVAL